MKFFFAGIIHFLLISSTLLGQDIIGFWKTINDKTGKPESIIAIYEYQQKYFGRLVATLKENGEIQDTMDDPKVKAPGVEGNPYYSGMDIIWNVKKEGSKYTDGKILDPEKGKIYNVEMWPSKKNLIVRGEIWIFGVNQQWIPAADNDFSGPFKKPDLTTFVPEIPKVKKR